MQMAFYFDQSRCSGCYACLIACKDWHEYDLGAEPENWIRIGAIEKGRFPDLSLSYLFIPCLHCAEPACAVACPANAITKRETDGVMVVDAESCLGKDECGGVCQLACPYQVPQFGDENNAKMQMCTFCADRLAEGKKPVCVAACPMRALDAGPLNELMTRYGDTKKAEGFTYSLETAPSIIFKPKRLP